MKKAIAAALIVTGMLSQGCATPGDTYSVYIDPALTSDMQETIIKAGDAWQANVSVHFTYIVGHCDGIHDKMICIHLSDSTYVDANAGIENSGDAVLASTMQGKRLIIPVDGAEMYIAVDAIQSHMSPGQYAWLPYETVAHELGHAMGLDHMNGVGALMDHYTDDSSFGKVTCNDVVQWYSIRHLVAPDCQ